MSAFKISIVFCSSIAAICAMAGTALADDANTPALRAPAEVTIEEQAIAPKRMRRTQRVPINMANYHWLDKVALAEPDLVPSICRNYHAAMVIAKHPRVGQIAEADHYLCRRLTRWKAVARVLAQNAQADRVIALDPEGIYSAIKRDKATARHLAKNPMLNEMIEQNPDLGELLAAYM